MNSVENYAIRYLEPKDVKDLDQYNALLRYTFQVTEDELTATGWKDEEIKQSKFPVLERADVLGCFDGDTLISQFAVYPLKMNIYGEVFPVGFVTSVCTYPEYTGQGIMKKLMYQSLEHMKQQGRPFALLYPYSIPLCLLQVSHHLPELLSHNVDLCCHVSDLILLFPQFASLFGRAEIQFRCLFDHSGQLADRSGHTGTCRTVSR